MIDDEKLLQARAQKMLELFEGANGRPPAGMKHVEIRYEVEAALPDPITR